MAGSTHVHVSIIHQYDDCAAKNQSRKSFQHARNAEKFMAPRICVGSVQASGKP